MIACYAFRLVGPGARGKRVSGTLLRDLLDALVDGVQQAVRLRVEGRSTAQGRLPAWLEQAATFDVVDVREGSTELVIEAAPLIEAAPDRFRQTELFTQIRVEDSCVDVFIESLNDAVTEQVDSDRFDDGLIGTFEQLGRVLRHEVESIEILNERPLRIEKESIEKFRRLRRAFPPDQRVVVAGKIDLLRHSDRVFTVVLEAGGVLRGVVTGDEVDLDELGRLWGQNAVVSGVAKFRPSGTVLRIEAEHVRPAGPADTAVWSQVPRPLLTDLDLRALHRPQGPRSGISAIFGQWPGDESEEEFLRTLDAI